MDSDTQHGESTPEGPETSLRFASDPEEQTIVDRIYSAVMEQRLAPRTKLSESQLCESFGVGRMRVRRALLLLASQGIVELRANRGAFIACPNAGEATDVFEARKLIEPRLIAQVSQRIDGTEMARLRAHIEREDKARERGERSEIIRLSGEFHVKLAVMSGNRVLSRMVGELVTRTSLIVGLFGVSGDLTCPENEHAAILAAIEQGDAARAEELVCHHLQHIQNGLDLSTNKQEMPDLVKILGTG